MTRKTKSEVDYSKGMPRSHCGVCAYFVAPHSCHKVAGRISEAMWCKLFKRAAR